MISPTVFVLGVVSLLTDLSSEMIYPLLPVFLSNVLGAEAVALGMIEGVAEATASIMKVFSGIWTDRAGKRKPLIVWGYGLAGFARPLIGLAGAWPHVLFLRFADRIGKGIRTSPRDALIADVTEPADRGSAYGVQRSMDHIGGVLGPLVAAGCMSFFGIPLRTVFVLAAVPAVLAFATLIFGVREPARHATVKSSAVVPGQWKNLDRNFRFFLLSVFLFTLGNSADAFLLLRLTNSGVEPAWIALLWSLHHVVKTTSTYYGGRVSDRLGRRPMIVVGWIYYAVIYGGFALIDGTTALIAIFLAYGAYFGFCEPSERALIADLAPTELRGTAFGVFHFIVGIGALPASALFGLIWKYWGSSAAFLTGAVLALLASITLFLIKIKQ
ncbi:MAG TPA: MFS transporter [Bdellovibrionota bacterium]|nr:MFS transporter [Bdellovibrionota bacterium]